MRNGLKLTCLDLQSAGVNRHYETCANSATQEIANFNPWPYGIEGGSAEFTGYTQIEGMQFPKNLELRIGKVPAVTVSLSMLGEEAPDPNLLSPPPGATERRYCDAMTAPVMIQKPDIASLRISEDVHVRFEVTVLTDGSVGAIQVLSQNSVDAAQRIRTVWKDARYKPAMCGNEPVVADVQEGLDITH